MDTRQQYRQATALLEKLCQAVEAAGWEIREIRKADKYPCVIYTSCRGEQTYPSVAAIHPMLKTVLFVLDLEISSLGEHSRELAVAFQLANNNLPIGNFDTFIDYEKVCYRLTGACPHMELPVEYLEKLLSHSINIAAEYEPLFFKLAEGSMTMRQFLKDRGTAEAAIMPEHCVSEKAKAVQEAICGELEKREISFETFEDSPMVVAQMPLEDGVMELILLVDAPLDVIHVQRRLPLAVSPLRRVDMAEAVSYITSQSNEGYFVYDVAAGTVDFRMTGFCDDSQAAAGTFLHIFERMLEQEQTYLEPLRQLNDGRLTLRSFRNQV